MRAEEVYVDPSALARLYIHQAGSREMSVWRAKVRGTLAVTGGNEEGRMQNEEVRVEATPRPLSGHLVANR